MNELIAYLLKASAGTIILYLCFLFFFRKDTFYFRNRIILILTLIIPLIIPLIRTSWFTAAAVPIEEAPIEVVIINSAISAGEIVTDNISSFDYNGLISAVWLSIVGLLIFRVIIGVIKTVSIIRKGYLKSSKIPKLILSDKDHPPFSFWPYAVIPRELFEENTAKEIIAHENAHIRQGHTFDLILSELYTSVFWFNPAAWLVRKSIKTNHEYLADHDLTCSSVNIKDYQYRLLNITEVPDRLQLAHSFNSLIKNRILMINRKPTRTYATWKNLLILPVVALIFAAFSFKAVNQADNYTNYQPETNKIKSQNSEAVREAVDIVREKISKEVKSKADTLKKSTNTISFVPGIGNVYAKVDQMPQFPGGEKEMMKFIRDNIKYPAVAMEKGIQGVVIASFIVNNIGKIENAKIMRSVGSGCDEEALRVIKSMPDWIPGKQGGKAVNVSFVIPISFALTTNYSQLKQTAQFPGEMPQFPGGDKEMMKFMKDNIKYPVIAQVQGITGSALALFVIGKSGKVANVVVTNQIHSSLKEEVIRTINKMPDWTPGKQDGKAVNVACTIPIRFILQSKGQESQSNPPSLQGDFPEVVVVGLGNSKPGEPSIKYGAQEKINIDSLLLALQNMDETKAPRVQFDNRIIKINEIKKDEIAEIKVIPPGVLVPGVDSEKGRIMITSKQEIQRRTVDGERAYVVVEQMPQFPGGEDEMRKFLSSNVKYPEEAKRNKVSGTVVANFIIDKEGKIRNAIILRGVEKSLDVEALRVLNSMPAWAPGKQGGKAVPVMYTIPVKFVLTPNETSTTSKQEEGRLTVNGEQPFVAVEQMPQVEQKPQYPGGDKAMIQFIMSNMKYPEEAKKKNIQGTVIVNFVIDKEGKIRNAKVVRSVPPDGSLNDEALRVINSMPAWTPGKQGGKVVAVSLSIPIKFAPTGIQIALPQDSYIIAKNK